MSWLIAMPVIILSTTAVILLIASFFIQKPEPYEWPEDPEEESW